METSLAFTIHINAPPHAVWDALTVPARMVSWMGEPELALTVETTWEVGTPIILRGTLHGPFENRGIVLTYRPATELRYTHRSSLSQLPDRPESDTTFHFQLSPAPNGTSLSLVISGFPDEIIFKHLRLYWSVTLHTLARSF